MTPSLLHSFAMGVLQGLTEFLPISSSAHLILIPHLMGWPDQGLAFDVSLHLGTLAGVLAFFWKDLAGLVGSWVDFRNPAHEPQRKLVIFIALATLPAAIIGLKFESVIETVLRSQTVAGTTLILGGLALAAADFFSRRERDLGTMSLPGALLIGCAQSLALVPGISRSGATIIAALALGFRRTEAARFSFLLSIPVIAGAGALKFREIWASPEQGVLLAGFLGAACSGFLAIWGLLKFVQTHRFTPFVIYRVLFGLAILLHFRG